MLALKISADHRDTAQTLGFMLCSYFIRPLHNIYLILLVTLQIQSPLCLQDIITLLNAVQCSIHFNGPSQRSVVYYFRC